MCLNYYLINNAFLHATKWKEQSDCIRVPLERRIIKPKVSFLLVPEKQDKPPKHLTNIWPIQRLHPLRNHLSMEFTATNHLGVPPLDVVQQICAYQGSGGVSLDWGKEFFVCRCATAKELEKVNESVAWYGRKKIPKENDFLKSEIPMHVISIGLLIQKRDIIEQKSAESESKLSYFHSLLGFYVFLQPWEQLRHLSLYISCRCKYVVG